MGCVKTISFDKFPAQSKIVGSRVRVVYHYNTAKTDYGTIVRDDAETPFETIIKLDNGKYVLGTECQYSFM